MPVAALPGSYSKALTRFMQESALCLHLKSKAAYVWLRSRAAGTPNRGAGWMVQIRGGKGAVQFLDGILYLRWNKGVVIGQNDAVAAVDALRSLGNGGKHPMLAQMGGLAWIGCKAQDIFAVSPPVTRVALLGSSPVDKMVVSFFIGRHRPPYPTQYFTSSDEALAWLKNGPAR